MAQPAESGPISLRHANKVLTRPSAHEPSQNGVPSMTELSSVRNLQQLEKSMLSYPARARLARAVRANVTQRDLIIVVGFALLGLLVTLAVIANVPDFVPATIETTLVP